MFANRTEAGRALAERIADLQLVDPVFVGLPRGGVPVAAEVARALDGQLDLILVGKLGVPGHSEYAMGAIGDGDVTYVDWNVVTSAGVTASQLTDIIRRESAKLRERAARLRAGRRPRDLSGRTVVVVDDGIATGSTAIAAVRVARDRGASRVIIASPLAPKQVIPILRESADDVVVLESPDPFFAVGQGYRDFSQVEDGEVLSILREMASSSAETERRSA